MEFTSRMIGFWGAIVTLAFIAVGQTTSDANANRPGIAVASGQLGGFVAFGGPVEVSSWQTVTGLPYSAEQVSERVQTLADGTHIQQRSQKAMLYRDSAGRTRTERMIMPPPGAVMNSVPGFIEITDPVAGYRYMLDQQNHTSRRMPWPPAMHHVSNTPPKSAASRAVLSFDPPSNITSPSNPGATASSTPASRPHPEISRESLGTQSIEGITAAGTRMTITYPEGLMGNDRPITTVSETWTSPELKITVLSKVSDPRNGDSTTKLTNVSRTEPEPALFEIPADYTIVDEPPSTVRQQPISQ